MLYSFFISPSHNIWEGCGNYRVKNSTQEIEDFWSPGQVWAVLPVQSPHTIHISFGRQKKSGLHEQLLLKTLNKLQILKGALQSRQKINRWKERAVLCQAEWLLSLLGYKMIPKPQEFTHNKPCCWLLVEFPVLKAPGTKVDIGWNFTWNLQNLAVMLSAFPTNTFSNRW